jgi:hypothetical protein
MAVFLACYQYQSRKQQMMITFLFRSLYLCITHSDPCCFWCRLTAQFAYRGPSQHHVHGDDAEALPIRFLAYSRLERESNTKNDLVFVYLLIILPKNGGGCLLFTNFHSPPFFQYAIAVSQLLLCGNISIARKDRALSFVSFFTTRLASKHLLPAAQY